MSVRKTKEKFIEEVYGLVGDEYTVLGDYINSSTKIEIYHSKCQKSFHMRPPNFLRGDRCSNCYKSKKKSHDEFLQEIYALVKDEYTVIGNYKNTNTKIEIKHNVCNFKYEVTPSKFLHGRRCPNCNKYKPLSLEEFFKKLRKDGKNEYKLIGEFKGVHKKTIIKHEKCGYEWNVTPAWFFTSENKCPFCSGNVKKKTTEIFKKEVIDRVDNEYTVLGEYKNTQEKVLMRHNICEHEWEVNPASFLAGSRCPKCNGGVRKTHEEFVDEVCALVKDEYEILGEYQNNITRLPILHTVCNQVSMICPSDFLTGVRCLHCNTSKGEKEVYSYLRNNNYIFEMQYKFEDCRNKRPLPFDFVVFEDKERRQIKSLIEYDGRQHFEPVDAFGGEKGFIETQRRDLIKDAYCEKNNIPLLRIPHWEFDNIGEILERELIKN